MDRKKIPAGTKQNLETVFDDVQNYTAENLKRRILTLFDTFGPIIDVTAGIIDAGSNALKITVTDTLQVTVQPGDALLEDGDMIRLSGSDTKTLSSLSADTLYVIYLKYTELGANPITAQNAFLYDTSGGTPYSTKNTTYTDSYTIEFTAAANHTAVVAALGTDETAVGIVKTNGAGSALLTDASFTFGGKTASGGVVDIRNTYNLRINSFVIPDNSSGVVKKDRASTIAAALTATELNASSASGTSGISGRMEVADLQADVADLSGLTTDNMTAGTAAIVSLTVDGAAVQTVLGTVTKPANIRVYDIWPTTSSSEPRGHIHIRWNYDKLESGGSRTGSGSTRAVYIEDTSYDGEDYSAMASGDVVGKLFRYTNTGSEYVIDSYDGAGGGVITLTVSTSTSFNGSDAISESYPAQIIDRYPDGYRLTFTKSSDSAYKIVSDLDDTFVSAPEFKTKLDLGENFVCGIKSYNDTSKSDIKETASFDMVLPDITDDGSLTATTTANGFVLAVGGWAGTGSDDTVHEYEYIYGAASDGFTGDLSSPDTPGLTRIISPLRTLPVTANIATTFSCGVLPLQNKQRVVADGDMKIPASPVAGGFAGEVVQDQVLLQKVKAIVRVVKGTIDGGSAGNDRWLVHLVDPVTGNPAAAGDADLEGEYISIDNAQEFKILRQGLSFVEV